jgi:hypothetical protein
MRAPMSSFTFRIGSLCLNRVDQSPAKPLARAPHETIVRLLESPSSSVSLSIMPLFPRKFPFLSNRLRRREEAAVTPEDSEIAIPLPPLPAEIWMQILEHLSFDALWFMRGTSHLWNSVALKRAREVVSLSHVNVQTDMSVVLQSQLILLSASERSEPSLIRKRLMVVSYHERLDPYVPDESSDIPDRSPDNIVGPSIASWRIKAKPFKMGEGTTYVYQPYALEIQFDLLSVAVKFSLRESRLSSGVFTELERRESWRLALRPRSGGFRRRSEKEKVPPIEGALSVSYSAEYKFDESDDTCPILDKLTLCDVTVPIWRIIGIWNDVNERQRDKERRTK